jgi:hypothetical protein
MTRYRSAITGKFVSREFSEANASTTVAEASHPVRRPGQTFHAHQQETADWLGCTVEQMNADHDRLHGELTKWTGRNSYALRMGRGESLTARQRVLADLEENAVLHLQRYMVAVGGFA